MLAGTVPLSTLTLVVSVPMVIVGAVLATLGAWNGLTWALIGSLEPTDVATAEDGIVELAGTVEGTPGGERVAAPFTGVECVGYSYGAEYYDTGDDGPGGWTTAEADTHLGQFLLDDGTGTALVDPESATVRLEVDDFYRTPRTLAGAPADVTTVIRGGTRIGAERVGPIDIPDNAGGYRFTESRLEEGDEVYVVGPATTTTPGVARLAVQVDSPWRYWGPFQVSDRQDDIAGSGRRVRSVAALSAGLALLAVGLFLTAGAL